MSRSRMCGIGGIYNWRRGAPAGPDVLMEMTRRMHHRGPDDRGIFHDGPIGFAHTRLSIIDLDSGAQPMRSRDGRYVISFNGEIYNYIEIREELKRLDHRFETESDTEVVLAAYAQWGLAFVERLNGMFAIAMWDQELEQLVLCRDRFGIKPLFWAETEAGLVFASEIPALRSYPGVGTKIDIDCVDEYFTCGFVSVPRSLVAGVQKVPPATILVVDKDGVTQTSYWSFRFEPDFETLSSDWEQQVRAMLSDSVRLQLRSDVPVGALLSGGLDSTLLCTHIADQLGGGSRLNSFCVGVDLPGAETEFSWANEVATDLGLAHQELRLSCEQFGDLLIEATSRLSEPIAEPMAGQLLAVCRFAAERVKVLLSGEGADEFWLGYPGIKVMAAIERVHALLPGPVRSLVGRALNQASNLSHVSARNAKYLRLFGEPIERRYLGVNFFDTELKQQLLSSDLRAHFRQTDSREYARQFYTQVGGPEPLSRMAAVDCQAWLVDNTLFRSDHLSMAASLEMRVPFLDHRLVELACRIPVREKINRAGQKMILKTAHSSQLSNRVANRKKVGFPTPLDQMFRGSWGSVAKEVLLGEQSNTSGMFNRPQIERLFAEHQSAQRDWSRLLFQVVAFKQWAATVG